jgi:two-component system, response regulator
MVTPHQSILIVEDSNEDYEATQRAFKKAGLMNAIYRCIDGDEVLDYLHRRGRYTTPEASPRPGIILLDLNLPGTDGREVLQEIKRDETLKSIPVIVLTTSDDEHDIRECYAHGANSYIHKPVNMAGFFAAIQMLSGYWFEVVILPRE